MYVNWLNRVLFIGSKTFYYKNRLFFRNDMWQRCKSCLSFIFVKKMLKNFLVCYKCGFHFNVSSRHRVKFFFNGSFFELYDSYLPVDFLNFFDTKYYYSRLVDAQMSSSETEALLVFKGELNGLNIVICVFEFGFIGGSMGRVVGEKFTSAISFCLKYKLPIVCFSSSGGARMQESLISLMQMSKVSCVINRLKIYKLPYLSILVNPCMGGVSASISMLGDINIAEPRALIGFAGPRVIKKTVKEELPVGFQSSEFLLNNGFLDFIVDRRILQYKIWNVLRILLKL